MADVDPDDGPFAKISIFVAVMASKENVSDSFDDCWIIVAVMEVSMCFSELADLQVIEVDDVQSEYSQLVPMVDIVSSNLIFTLSCESPKFDPDI